MEKGYISIGKAAKTFGVTTMTLRRWDKSGRLKPLRTPSGRRMYSVEQVEACLRAPILDEAIKWVFGPKPEGLEDRFYCQTSSIFQLRIMELEKRLLEDPAFSKTYSLIVAATGEIGNNSFDHNIGNWPDVVGIFFAYDLKKRQIVLADRGRGILETLKRVKPELENDGQALKVAFTEIISGRAPEERGNGLKFVKKIVPLSGIEIFFQTGSATARISGEADMRIGHAEKAFRGCLAWIKF